MKLLLEQITPIPTLNLNAVLTTVPTLFNTASPECVSDIPYFGLPPSPNRYNIKYTLLSPSLNFIYKHGHVSLLFIIIQHIFYLFKYYFIFNVIIIFLVLFQDHYRLHSGDEYVHLLDPCNQHQA